LSQYRPRAGVCNPRDNAYAKLLARLVSLSFELHDIRLCSLDQATSKRREPVKRYNKSHGGEHCIPCRAKQPPQPMGSTTDDCIAREDDFKVCRTVPTPIPFLTSSRLHAKKSVVDQKSVETQSEIVYRTLTLA
jgi:hypothetical protein